MAIVQRLGQRQEFPHGALWSTYLPRAPRRGKPARRARSNDEQPLEEALAAIESLWPEVLEQQDRTRLALIGTALWNLLDGENYTPEKFSTLLLEVLQLDVDRAQELRAQPSHAVFPPLPETFNDPELPEPLPVGPLISDSSFRARKNKKTDPYAVRARLEVCVERDFDELSQITDPMTWPERSRGFWEDMRVTDDGWKGGLRLPGDDRREIVDVVLVGARNTTDATRNDAELYMQENEWISGGVFRFQVTPESSRPGWTRIIHEREVTFVSPALRQHQLPTLTYWTKSEIACLALI